MPIIKSAKKRVRVAQKASARNVKTKRLVRDSLKAFHQAISGGKAADITKAEKTAFSALDKAVKKNVLHKNKAARRKSQIAVAVKSAGTKKTKAQPAAKKSTPKSPAKKTTIKKKTK
jgi:small subunit ribosomal protein S20